MKTILKLFAFCALVCFPLLVKSEDYPWIELSYQFNNKTIYWPTAKSFERILVHDNSTAAYVISAAEHGGTHINAPRHFAQGKWTTDQIPLDRLIGSAVKIDMSVQATQNKDYQLTPDFMNWEKQNGAIPDEAIVLIFTGWGNYWPDRKSYLGTETKNASLLHFPGIHSDGGDWLVNHRTIKLVGIDTASIDYGQSTIFETHRMVSAKNIPVLENVANMEKLPTKGFLVYAAPMFITGGSGAPCRVFARLDENDKKDCVENDSGAVTFHRMFMFLAISLPLLFVFM